MGVTEKNVSMEVVYAGIKTIVPAMSTYPDSNPEMFCNHARENRFMECCIGCINKDCRNYGRKVTNQ